MKYSVEDRSQEPEVRMGFVEGDWNSENFLIVEPGQKIVASFDDLIIKAVVAKL